MKQIKNLDYKKMILIDDSYFDGTYNQRIYLEKTHNKSNDQDQYFLKLFQLIPGGKLLCQGYIYFYIDFLNKESKFIGMYVKPEYRNMGYASLLMSNWIKLCLDNDLYNLTTNEKQRKPFLLYMLKTFYFELRNKNEYNTSNFSIDICSNPDDLNKYLLFHNEIQKEAFLNSPIYREDNYRVLNSLIEDIHVLDTVILSHSYFVQDENEAYKRSLKYINSKK